MTLPISSRKSPQIPALVTTAAAAAGAGAGTRAATRSPSQRSPLRSPLRLLADVLCELHQACSNGQPDTVEELLAAHGSHYGALLLEGADPATRLTPLQVAVRCDSSACARELMRRGASVHVVEEESANTLAHLAALHGSLELVQMVSARCPDELGTRNANGHLPHEIFKGRVAALQRADSIQQALGRRARAADRADPEHYYSYYA